MTSVEILEILERQKAVITGSHIVYTSGKHGSAYVDKDAIYTDTECASELCREMARRFLEYGSPADVVLAPATGGIVLSQWTAHHLSTMTGSKILSVYAEKADGGNTFVIKRGYDKLVSGRRVLILEDVLNTGGSVKKVVDAIRQAGGTIAGVAGLCNRGGVTPEDLSIEAACPFFTLITMSLEAWNPQDCPLCRQGIPINTDVGKG